MILTFIIPVVVGALFFHYRPITRTLNWLESRKKQAKSDKIEAILKKNKLSSAKNTPKVTKVGHIDPVLGENEHICTWPEVNLTGHYTADIIADKHEYEWQPGDICACADCGEQRILVFRPKGPPYYIQDYIAWIPIDDYINL